MLYSPLKGPDIGAGPVHWDGKILQGNNHYQGPHFPPISAPYFSSFICLDVGPLSVISAESGLHFVKKKKKNFCVSQKCPPGGYWRIWGGAGSPETLAVNPH